MRFVENPAFEQEIALEPEYQAGKLRVAEEVKNTAQRVAPKKTRYYVRHLGVVEADGVFVSTDDPFGHMVEWGSANNHPYAPIRRAVIESGLKLREIPKPS